MSVRPATIIDHKVVIFPGGLSRLLTKDERVILARNEELLLWPEGTFDIIGDASKWADLIKKGEGNV